MMSRLAVHARRLAAAAVLGLAATASAGAAPGEMIDVTIDFAKVLKLERPAATIIIGNPGIADATIGDEETIVLTGKAAGTTNLIVMDQEGREIANSTIRVSSDVQQLTTVFYGSNRQTFSCAPTCEQVISVGDDPESFDSATSQIQTRTEFAAGQ